MKVPALYDGQRAVLFRWGMLIAAAACALAPLCGSSSGIAPESSIADALAIPGLEPFRTPAPISIARDPFIPRFADLPFGSLVEAVVLGAVPRALVSIGRRPSIVGIGDAVAGSRVRAIDAYGVVLSDGTRLWLRGAAPR